LVAPWSPWPVAEFRQEIPNHTHAPSASTPPTIDAAFTAKGFQSTFDVALAALDVSFSSFHVTRFLFDVTLSFCDASLPLFDATLSLFDATWWSLFDATWSLSDDALSLCDAARSLFDATLSLSDETLFSARPLAGVRPVTSGSSGTGFTRPSRMRDRETESS
jgi:hypothetical protein